MKAKVLIMLLAGMLAFASCGTRYGHVPKVKGKQQHTAVKKTTKEKQRQQETAVTIEPKKDAVAIAEGSTAVNTEQAVAPTSTQKVKTRKNRTQAAETVAPAPEQAGTVLKPNDTRKLERIKKQLKQNEGSSVHSWLWYIIIGVIFILLAAIIGGLVGYILYVVGVIAIIFGLLALIGIV
jgi:Flp pilus assembly protein TadB